MEFTGFTKKDFDVFHIDGLESRMEQLRQHISPKLEAIGQELSTYLSMLANEEMYYHVAKHARRTKNPPKDTWVAWSNNKRGYKSLPHFQIGLFDDRVFIWLAYIYELPNKKQIAQKYLDNLSKVTSTIPQNYVISLDHTKKDSFTLKDVDDFQVEESLVRLRDVKKGEFLIGQHIDPNDPVLRNGKEFLDFVKDIFEHLMPLYKMSF